MLDEYNDNLANTKAREGTLKEDDRQPMDAYNRARHEERLHQAALKVRQLENEIGALKEGKTTKAVKEKLEGQFSSDELYGNFNILNTAINNNDQKTIDRIIELRRKADRAAFNAQHSKLTPREEIYEMLKDRIGGILRREKNYDTYEATINKERVELSVSEEAAKKILRLRNIVEAPRSRTVNGKKVQVRSLLQQLHDLWDDYNAREEQLTALKNAKAPADKIAKKKEQVAKTKEKYQKKFEEVAEYRQQLDAELAKLYKKSGEFAPVEGTKGEPTIKTPRQKQEELEKLGKSARDTSRPVKTAANIQAGKVKVSEAKVAQELGETMAEYQAFAAPYQKRLQAKVDQFNKFIDTANERLAKLKETLVDANEVAAVEKQLNLAIKVRDAVPDENPIEKDKASKKVNSLKEHLKVVKTPKEDKYKLAEANLVKIAKDRRAELDALKAELTKVVGEKAVALGKKHPDFKTKLAEAKKDYQESLQDSVQEVKSLRTPQVTRKIAKLGSVRTSSEESRSASQRRQEAFEADLSEAKGEAFDYQQRQEAIERTNRKRIAKEGKGSAMEVALTKAAQERLRKEAQAQERKSSGF
jgi:ABC-type transporter Mla subunit MlaD